ncbi:MAG: Uma2 family endonuclease [Gemmatimonadota bacterium]
MTADDLLHRNPFPHARTELRDGRLIVREPPFLDHGSVTVRIAYALGTYLRADRIARGAPRDRGRLVSNDSGFWIRRQPDTVRAPDVAYILDEHWPADPACWANLAPELAVEVRSRSDRAGYLSKKLSDWAAAGCKHVWIADPRRRTLTIHDNGDVITLHTDEHFEGGPLFPGLDLDVGALFD